jgi:hypothetical protein
MSDRDYVNPQLLWEPAELQARLNDPQLCLIDTRTGEEYAQGHIGTCAAQTNIGEPACMPGVAGQFPVPSTWSGCITLMKKVVSSQPRSYASNMRLAASPPTKQ